MGSGLKGTKKYRIPRGSDPGISKGTEKAYPKNMLVFSKNDVGAGLPSPLRPDHATGTLGTQCYTPNMLLIRAFSF
jgi:hypothetical protein